MKSPIIRNLNTHKFHEDLKRQLKIFREQGEIGIKIAKGILEDFVQKGRMTRDEAEEIASDLKI